MNSKKIESDDKKSRRAFFKKAGIGGAGLFVLAANPLKGILNFQLKPKDEIKVKIHPLAVKRNNKGQA